MDTDPLRCLYLKVAESIQPRNREVIREISKIDLAIQDDPLDRFLDAPIDKYGFYKKGDMSRITTIKDDTFAFRKPDMRDTLLRRYVVSRNSQELAEKALTWLASQQNPKGSWGSDEMSLTALSVICYLTAGELPGSAKFGATVENGLKFLVLATNGWLIPSMPQLAPQGVEHEDGIVDDGFNTYLVPITALALAEGYGMTGQEQLKSSLAPILDIIIKGQLENGGFSHQYRRRGWDLNLTAWHAQALHMAKKVGMDNPGLDQAIKRLNTFLHEEPYDKRKEHFVNRPRDKEEEDALQMNGCAAYSIYLTGDRSDSLARSAVRYLADDPLRAFRGFGNNPDVWGEKAPLYLNNWYWNTYAFIWYRNQNRNHWEQWIRAMEKLLEANQKPEGYWEGAFGDGMRGRTVTTLHCILILKAPFRHDL